MFIIKINHKKLYNIAKISKHRCERHPAAVYITCWQQTNRFRILQPTDLWSKILFSERCSIYYHFPKNTRCSCDRVTELLKN